MDTWKAKRATCVLFSNEICGALMHKQHLRLILRMPSAFVAILSVVSSQAKAEADEKCRRLKHFHTVSMFTVRITKQGMSQPRSHNNYSWQPVYISCIRISQLYVHTHARLHPNQNVARGQQSAPDIRNIIHVRVEA